MVTTKKKMLECFTKTNLHVSPVGDQVGNQSGHQTPKSKVVMRAGSKYSLDLTWRRKQKKFKSGRRKHPRKGEGTQGGKVLTIAMLHHPDVHDGPIRKGHERTEENSLILKIDMSPHSRYTMYTK